MRDGGPDAFRLAVPPDAQHVSTARIFAAAVARVVGADETTIEDVKVGVSEACSMSLREPHGESPVEVSVIVTPDRLRFEVTGDLPPDRPGTDAPGTPTPTPTGIAATLGREVVAALFEDAEISGAAGRGTIRFSAPLDA